MKKYLIMKVTTYNNNKSINYHSECTINNNLERSWNYAFTDYNKCEAKLREIEYYDMPYWEKGFKFEYIIIEKEGN